MVQIEGLTMIVALNPNLLITTIGIKDLNTPNKIGDCLIRQREYVLYPFFMKLLLKWKYKFKIK